jgi:hypothetical protein
MKTPTDTNAPDVNDATALKSRWLKPELRRLSAGSAEQGPTPLSDSSGELS